MINDYEVIIGLEVHIELGTDTKIFCSCSTKYGALPNTQTCPVCAGLPGSLPVLNEKVVEYAIKAGLATKCSISAVGKLDRKNYFYPDLPKAYQISQLDFPLCENGYIDIEVDGDTKRIRIERIHIEEDAGKLVHSKENEALIDYNRSGVPLIEIVSAADLRSAEEAKQYLQKVRAIMMYAEVSECKMNEGALRCDVNVSVNKKGAMQFGTRAEIKNINSFNFVGRAIEYETKRQIEILESGKSIKQETRRWDASKGETFAMRTKEASKDYRYFQEPDLVPIFISSESIDKIKSKLPLLPDERKKDYIEKYGLSPYDAEQITATKYFAEYFEEAIKYCKDIKLIVNIITTDIFRIIAQSEDNEKILIKPKYLGELGNLIKEGVINQTISKKVINNMWDTNESPDEIVDKLGLKQITNEKELEEIAKEIIRKNEKIVNDYLAGRNKAFQALVGLVMKETKGKANPVITQDVLKKVISEIV